MDTRGLMDDGPFIGARGPFLAPGGGGGIPWPEFDLPLNDAGSGAVNLLLQAGNGAATFTRATIATTIGSTGLIIPVSSGVARSYYDPTTLAYQGYLAEGARTNLCLQSENLAVSWTLDGATQSAAGASPISGVNYQRMLADAGSSPHRAYQAVTLGAGAVTFSTFAKAGTVEWIGIGFGLGAVIDGAFFNLSTGVVGTVAAGSIATIDAYQDGYRCTVTRTNPTDFVQIEIHDADGQAAVWNAAGTESIDVIGHQAEDAAFASSYIPTTTVAVTKNIDVDSYPTSGNILAASGTYFGKIAFTHAPSGTVFLWGTYVDASNYTAVLHDGTNLIFRKRIAGVNTDATQALAFTAGTQYKIACSWGALGQLIAINGASGTPHANTTAAQIAATMQFGADGNGANAPFAALADDRIWQTQFTAAQLQAITA